MAVLTAPFNAAQVQGLRGVVDFYYWRGIPVARAWPRKPNQPNSAAQLAQRAAYGAASQWIKTTPGIMREQYRLNVSTIAQSWVDWCKHCQTRNARAGTLLPHIWLEITPQPDIAGDTTKRYTVTPTLFDGAAPFRIHTVSVTLNDGQTAVNWQEMPEQNVKGKKIRRHFEPVLTPRMLQPGHIWNPWTEAQPSGTCARAIYIVNPNGPDLALPQSPWWIIPGNP